MVVPRLCEKLRRPLMTRRASTILSLLLLAFILGGVGIWIDQNPPTTSHPCTLDTCIETANGKSWVGGATYQTDDRERGRERAVFVWFAAGGLVLLTLAGAILTRPT